MRLGILIISLGFLLATGITGASLHAQEPDRITAIITSPVSNEQLFGQVQVRGSAAHPTAFESFALEYDDLGDPAVQWNRVQPPVQQQVQDGELGAWNTNFVPDGVYQLRLRVFLSDGQMEEFIVSSLRVINSAPTPIPTTGAVIDPGVPTPGPSPTSPIEQPPNTGTDITGLDQPSAETSPPSDFESTTESTATTRRVNMRRVWRAFCSGVYLALGAFGIMFGYLLIRGRLRPITQRLLWQIQDDLHDR